MKCKFYLYKRDYSNKFALKSIIYQILAVSNFQLLTFVFKLYPLLNFSHIFIIYKFNYFFKSTIYIKNSLSILNQRFWRIKENGTKLHAQNIIKIIS